MTFTNLSAPVALTTVAVVTLLVIVLYVLRPPPPRVMVASVMLWRRIAEARRRRRLWRRLLSTFVSLLVALSLAAAIGGLDGSSTADGELLLVVDDSATMATRTDGGSTRLELARGLALSLIADWQGPVVLADTTGAATVQRAHTRTAARGWLEQLEPKPGEAYVPAQSAAAPTSGFSRAVLITDGVGVAAPAGFEILSAFQPATNVGLTAFAVGSGARTADSPLVEITNGSPAPTVATLVVASAEDGRALVRRDLELAAGETFSARLRLSGSRIPPDALLEARVTAPGDSLGTDDTAYARLAGASPVTVALVTADPELDELLRSLAGVAVHRIPMKEASDALLVRVMSEQGAGLAVLDRWAPDAQPDQPLLLIAPPQRPWLPTATEVDGGSILAQWPTATASEPAAFAVDTASAVSYRPELGFRPLISGVVTAADDDERPAELPLALYRDEPPAAILALPIAESNLSRSEAFPILVGELIDRLASPALSRPAARPDRRTTLVNRTSLAPYHPGPPRADTPGLRFGPGILLAISVLFALLETWTRAVGVTE